jgi:hypothetical protein
VCATRPSVGPRHTGRAQLMLRSQSELRSPNYDTRLLFVTRFTRLFAYGALSVVLVFYLTGIGLGESRIGMLLTLILLAVAVQHQPNGCSDEAVLHNGSCSSRRAICRCRHHGSGANNRRLYPTDVCWPHVRQAAFDQRSVLHRRNSKDRLRPSALSAIRGNPTTRRGIAVISGSELGTALSKSADNRRIELQMRFTF